MTAQDTAGLVERARAYKSYNHLNDGALISELADALEAMGRELVEAQAGHALVAKHNAEIEAEHEETFDKLTTAERLLSESQAEGRRKDEALEPFAKVLKGNWSKQSDDAPIVAGMNQYDLRLNLKLGDFRRARTALAASDEGDGHG